MKILKFTLNMTRVNQLSIPDFGLLFGSVGLWHVDGGPEPYCWALGQLDDEVWEITPFKKSNRRTES